MKKNWYMKLLTVNRRRFQQARERRGRRLVAQDSSGGQELCTRRFDGDQANIGPNGDQTNHGVGIGSGATAHMATITISVDARNELLARIAELEAGVQGLRTAVMELLQ